MNQKIINEICKKLGIEPIVDLPLPSEEEFEKMHNMFGWHTFDRSYHTEVAYNNFKQGYILSEIRKRIN